MGEFVQSFGRGLSVIRSFADARRPQTLSDVARATGLSRAAARRLVLTLEELGYVRNSDGRYALTPRVLELGYAYLASFSVPEMALPYLERLAESLREASSVAVLDDTEIVYVARVPAHRIMTVSIGLGTRFPAYRTSLGRVLMAALPDDEVRSLWGRSDRSGGTEHTVRRLEDLQSALAEVRSQGWALVDQELEIGVRSLAAPITSASGETVAAVNLSTHAGRTTRDELLTLCLPELLATAADVSRAFASHPVGLSR
jgi:IclR family pca regulon transcriptional regulator